MTNKPLPTFGYFVSFFHAKGFGYQSMNLFKEILSSQDVESVRKLIEDHHPQLGSISILNWKRLPGDDIK